MMRLIRAMTVALLFVSTNLLAQESDSPAEARASLDDRLRSMLVELSKPGVAPTCTDSFTGLSFPGKVSEQGECDDGDSTLFNGLLCSVGVEIACDAIEAAQIAATGEWLRSPRFVSRRDLRPSDSFSPDMALGVQAYAMGAPLDRTGTRFLQWLTWIEVNRPCVIGEEPNCVRGWPRFCRDDTEKGCTLRPGDIAQLAHTTTRLSVTPPPTLQYFFGQAGDTTARNGILWANSQANDLGFPLHLVGVDILLARMQSTAPSELLDAAADNLARRQPLNPFFRYLAEGASDATKARTLEVCPASASSVPKKRVQWAWERKDSDQAWKDSMVWDCIFMANLLLPKGDAL